MRLVLSSLLCLNAFAAAPDPNPAKLLDTALIRFEPVPGQSSWRARGLGYSFLFSDQAATLRIGNRAVELSFPGSRRSAEYRAADRFQASTNYFIGKSYRN